MDFTPQVLWFAVCDIRVPEDHTTRDMMGIEKFWNKGEMIQKDHFAIFDNREDAVTQCIYWAGKTLSGKIKYPEKDNFRVVKQVTTCEVDDDLITYFKALREIND